MQRYVPFSWQWQRKRHDDDDDIFIPPFFLLEAAFQSCASLSLSLSLHLPTYLHPFFIPSFTFSILNLRYLPSYSSSSSSSFRVILNFIFPSMIHNPHTFSLPLSISSFLQSARFLLVSASTHIFANTQLIYRFLFLAYILSSYFLFK